LKLEICNKSACLLKSVNSIFPKESVFGIGLEGKFYIGVGSSSELALPRSIGSAAWCGVEDFVRKNEDRWIAGYIGYDIVFDGTKKPSNNTIPMVHLVSPDSIYEISESGSSCLLSGCLPLVSLSSFKSEHLEPKPLVSLADYDAELDNEYLTCVSLAYDWVSQGKENTRRMTVSRRVVFNASFDMTQSIIPLDNEPESSTPCYWRSERIEFSGLSPEQTFFKTQNSNVYHCQKLSGTYARSHIPSDDNLLFQYLLQDLKINTEHDISAADLIHNVEKIGIVTNVDKSILNMPKLRHLLTSFDLSIYENINLISLCKAIYPKGVQPTEGGLEKVFQFESMSRGPYYGIFFIKTPSGAVLGLHIIRMLFRDISLNLTYSNCGACITRGSSIMDEYEETRLKLASIVARI